MGTTDSSFNRRRGNYAFNTPGGQRTWSGMVQEWANKVGVHLDWSFSLSGPAHALTYTATPSIDGVWHVEYSGTGSSHAKAKDRACEKIANSGHCHWK